VTTPDPNGSADERSTFYGQRLIAFLDHSPELYGRAQALVVDDKEPSLGAEGSADLVLSMRTLHGNVANGTLDAWLAAVHRVLKSRCFRCRGAPRAADAVAQESAKKVICRRNG